MALIAPFAQVTRSTNRSTPCYGDHQMPVTERYRDQGLDKRELRQAGDVVDLDCQPFFIERVEDTVASGPQAPQIWRPVRKRLGRPRLIGKPANRVPECSDTETTRSAWPERCPGSGSRTAPWISAASWCTPARSGRASPPRCSTDSTAPNPRSGLWYPPERPTIPPSPCICDADSRLSARARSRRAPRSRSWNGTTRHRSPFGDKRA